MSSFAHSVRFNTEEPLVTQLAKHNLEFDQLLQRALQVSASKPNLHPEDIGFPDSYLTLALYRLNSILTRLVDLNEQRYNLFHDYKLAPSIPPEEVVPGTRLCRILDRTLSLIDGKTTIGVGHFLKAIVSLSLDVPPIPAVGFRNQVVHNTFSVETLLWGLGYTAWTPISDAPEIRNILEALDGREPLEDVQYLMTFSDNRIVFRPASILDSYQLQNQSTGQRAQLALLTHFQDQYACVRPTEILELEDLINSKRTHEGDLQHFFEAHPYFFRKWDYRDIYPHVYLTREAEGPLIPDFILVDPELQKAMVIDLKLPTAKLVRHKHNRDRFTSAIEDARAQLLEYRDWFEDTDNRSRIKKRFGIEIFRPRLGVIIGTSQDFRSELERQRLAAQYPDVEVVTYDDIVKYAERRLLLLRQTSHD